MNKTVLVVLVLLSAAGLSTFANGTGETSGATRPRGGSPAYSGEPITLTGTLDLEQGDGLAALKTGSETWSLMVPHMYDYDVPVKSGDTVTVTGFEMPGPRWDRENGERYLMVQKAVIAGREYTLPGGYGRGSMMGRVPGYGY